MISSMFSVIGFALTMPLLPRYVEGELGGGKISVGIAVGIFSISAIAARPLIGRIGDQQGRRVLLAGGALVTAVAIAAHAFATTLLVLLLFRLAVGVGQAAFFVGSTTLVNDIAPMERRGEATNYLSVAIYTGMSFGPLIGEIIEGRWGFGAAFVASGASLLVAALVSLALSPHRPASVTVVSTDGPLLTRLFHPAAFWPGLVLFLGIINFTALNAFMPLHVEEQSLGSAGSVFLLFGIIVLFVRLLGSRIPDRLGTTKTGTIALTGIALGMWTMGAWTTTTGLYVATVILAGGGSMLFPSLLVAAIDGVPEGERARAVSTFTMFFEISAGIGGLVLGVSAAIGGNTAAFFVAGVSAALGLPVLYFWQRVCAQAAVPSGSPG